MAQTHLDSDTTSRRRFLGKAATLTAASVAASSVLSTSGCSSTLQKLSGNKCKSLIGKGDTVLLQGDSITDAGRNKGRENNVNDIGAMGHGYALLIMAGLLGKQHDPELKIYNRGISGHKVFQLAERWDKDCLELKPDLVSILIGVNDIWHKLDGRYDGTIEIYERDYRALLERTRQALPEVKFVICEPFVLRCGAVNDKWFPDFDGYRAAAKRVATDFQTVFVPFQTMFDKAIQDAPPEYWAADGVHPTLAGAQLMAQAWLEAVTG